MEETVRWKIKRRKSMEVTDNGPISFLTWHSLRKILSVLSRNHSNLTNDIRLKNILKKIYGGFSSKKDQSKFSLWKWCLIYEAVRVFQTYRYKSCNLMNQKETVRDSHKDNFLRKSVVAITSTLKVSNFEACRRNVRFLIIYLVD